jgi:hypothetical protein
MSGFGTFLRRLFGGAGTGAPVAVAPVLPAEAPVEVPAPVRPAGPRYEYSLVACARWEEETIQEWIEYHKSIGFSHIYLYSNDDDPQTLFKAVSAYVYGDDPFVTFLHWPHHGQQIQIYLHFLKTLKHETAWYSFLDIDEFLVLKDIDDIGRFMRDYEPHVDCLYLNWVVYGHNGKARRDDQPTLTSYPRRANGVDQHTKMLCRSAAIDASAIEAGVRRGLVAFHHFLDNFQLPGVRCRDVLLEPTDGYSKAFPKSADPFVQREGFAPAVLSKAYVAHFQFRSEEDFLRRWKRGGFPQDEIWKALSESGGHRGVMAPRNAVYDTYLASYWYRYTAGRLRVGISEPAGIWGENVALHKPSYQSSVYLPDGAEPPGSRVVGGGNDGVQNAGYGFHTDPEMRPWWMVDLLAPHRVSSIHIYNRRGEMAERANELEVLGSEDGAAWVTLWSNPARSIFGTDGSPLVVTAPVDFTCRFVLLRLRGAGILHLVEIEVYGQAVPGPVPALPDAGPVVSE